MGNSISNISNAMDLLRLDLPVTSHIKLEEQLNFFFPRSTEKQLNTLDLGFQNTLPGIDAENCGTSYNKF